MCQYEVRACVYRLTLFVYVSRETFRAWYLKKYCFTWNILCCSISQFSKSNPQKSLSIKLWIPFRAYKKPFWKSFLFWVCSSFFVSRETFCQNVSLGLELFHVKQFPSRSPEFAFLPFPLSWIFLNQLNSLFIKPKTSLPMFHVKHLWDKSQLNT
jgi:hypothetical protein